MMPDETLRIARFLFGFRHQAGWAGWIVVAGAKIAAALCGIVPASMIAIAAGMIYGTLPGFLVCAPAILIGSVVAFRLSRSLSARVSQGSLNAILACSGWTKRSRVTAGVSSACSGCHR